VGKSAKKAKEPKTDDPAAIRKLAEARRATLPAARPDFSAKRTKEVEEAFLDGLRSARSISRSAWAAGISEKSAYDWRKASQNTLREDGTYRDDFCVRWEEAHQAGVDMLEDEAIRRAAHGVEKPVYQGGVLVGAVTEYSDTLMMLVLRGKAPKTYNTERHEHTGKDGGAMEMNMTIEFVKSEQKK
jgi:hypothetical protein